MRQLAPGVPVLLAAAPLQAQSEAELRQYFEGKRVTLKIAMPGTEEGVDVYPGTDRPSTIPGTPSASRTTAPRSSRATPP